MTEVEFLGELARRTGCGLLCDVSNVFLSGHNMGYDPYRYIDAFPVERSTSCISVALRPKPTRRRLAGEILIDTHGAAIAESVWELYAHAVRRFGPTPTLIEWDNDIPPFATLAAEAARADEVAAMAQKRVPCPRWLTSRLDVRQALTSGDVTALESVLVGGGARRVGSRFISGTTKPAWSRRSSKSSLRQDG